MGLGRAIIYTIHAILLFIAIMLIFCGFVTPRWQEMQFMQSGDIHQHGLFEDCTYGFRENAIRSWLCTFKDFSHPTYYSAGGYSLAGGLTGGGSAIAGDMAYNAEIGHHDNAWWRVEIIALLVCGMLLMLIALVFTFCGCCQEKGDNMKGAKITTLIAAVCEGLGVLLVAAGVIYFIRMAYMPFVRTALEAGQTVREQQNFGVSFYVATVGMVLGMIAFAIGAFAAVSAFMAEKREGYYFRRPVAIKHQQPTPVMVHTPDRDNVFTVNNTSQQEYYQVIKKREGTPILELNGSPHVPRSRTPV